MHKAGVSRFYLWLLNLALWHGIPFNKPHRLEIIKIEEYLVEIRLPYRKSNWNHLKGLHACALASLLEYATGLLLISHLDPEKYRLIMQSLQITYYFQGKKDAIVRFGFDKDWLQRAAISPLQTEDSVFVAPEVEVFDTDGNRLCSGKVNWQLKHWQKVQTQIHGETRQKPL